MPRFALLLLVVALFLAVAVSAQMGPGGPPPGGPGMEGPGPGMPGMPGMMPPMMSQNPVMLLAPEKYLYVIYGGTLFQFDANTLELLKQVSLMPPMAMPMMGIGGSSRARGTAGVRRSEGGWGQAPAMPAPPPPAPAPNQ